MRLVNFVVLSGSLASALGACSAAPVDMGVGGAGGMAPIGAAGTPGLQAGSPGGQMPVPGATGGTVGLPAAAGMAGMSMGGMAGMAMGGMGGAIMGGMGGMAGASMGGMAGMTMGGMAGMTMGGMAGMTMGGMAGMTMGGMGGMGGGGPTVATFADVHPILVANCTGTDCHGDGAEFGHKFYASATLATSEPLVTDNIDTILTRINLPQSDPMHMPQNQPPLAAEDIATIESWADTLP